MSEAVQILLVEDDSEERALAARALAGTGWQVTEAASAAAALRALRKGGNFIVLLGLRLPDMEGRELLARLAADHPETPAVVVTGVDDIEVAIDAMQRGAWDYVVKRADHRHLDQLRHVLARTLERRQLVRERNRYRDEMEALAIALRGTTDGVAILDPVGRVSFANRALAAAWKQRESAVVGRLLGEFVHMPGDESALGDVLAAVGERGRWSGELRTRGVEPPLGMWDVTLTPIRCPDSPRRGVHTHTRTVVGIFRDVSDKHALEQLRADFLSMITHDIKVPLTVILGYTEMLTDPEPPPGEIPPDILTRIRESGETIHALVCNFLDLSRIEAGRMTLDRRPFDVREMLAHSLEHYESTARRKGITLGLEGDRIPPLVADETQLERVVTNLLANAIKYTPAGGRVTIAVGRENGHAVIAFRDTGRGIPADELPHLFEKYRRVREAKRTEGTGLGLFIAKTIVEAHGGDIRVESAPGVGSTFTLLLPLA
jgi:two-component system phosphate regulon sensor histidine kinase PhoR